MAEETPQTNKPEASDPAAEPAANPAEMAMESVDQAAEAVITAADAGDDGVQLPEFNGATEGVEKDAADMSLLNDVSLCVKLELGRTLMYVEDVLRLNPDSVIELDKAAGDPVDIYVNDRHVARGEVLVLNENFCVRVSEIIQSGGPEE